jgi:hypothetical protein
MMVQELIERLQQRHAYVMGLVDELFGISPSKPNIVIARSLDILPEKMEIEWYEELDEQTEGKYNSRYKLIVVNPVQIITACGVMGRAGFQLNPKYWIERIFAKEYAQHVLNSLFDFRLGEIFEIAREEKEGKFYEFAKAHAEAVGYAAMLRVAKQIPHRDEYELAFKYVRDSAATYLASQFKQHKALSMPAILVALYYDMAEQSSALDIDGFREWVRRDPLKADKEEVENAYKLFVSRMSSIITRY